MCVGGGGVQRLSNMGLRDAGVSKNYFNTGGVDFMKTNQVELKAAFGPRQAVGLHFVQGQAD